jgi:hypothetical protein
MKARKVYGAVPDRSGLYRLRRMTLPATGRDALIEQGERLRRLALDLAELERRLPPRPEGGRRE